MSMREAREAQQRDPMSGVDLSRGERGTVETVAYPQCSSVSNDVPHTFVTREGSEYRAGTGDLRIWQDCSGCGNVQTVLFDAPSTPVYGPLRKWGAVAALVTGLVLSVGGASAVAGEPDDSPFWVTRVCAQEDSRNCAWDAGTDGNGRGQSFVTRDLPGDANRILPGRQVTTCVFYTDRDYARTHDWCDTSR
jgi:hypothetical protein